MSMPTFLSPHQYINYIDEYLDLVINKYGVMRPNYFCTYYKLDYDNSVLDERPDVDAGSYHIVGPELSGRKWKRIELMPVWLTEGGQPIQNMMKEEGITREINNTFVFPDYVGVRPTAGDYMYIYNDISNKREEDAPLYKIVGREDSLAGKRKIYRVTAKNTYDTVRDLEKDDNISSYWIYINFFRKIFADEPGRKILETLSYSYDLFERLKTDTRLRYDVNINMYIAGQKKEK